MFKFPASFAIIHYGGVEYAIFSSSGLNWARSSKIVSVQNAIDTGIERPQSYSVNTLTSRYLLVKENIKCDPIMTDAIKRSGIEEVVGVKLYTRITDVMQILEDMRIGVIKL